MERPRRAQTVDWENDVLALDKGKQLQFQN